MAHRLAARSTAECSNVNHWHIGYCHDLLPNSVILTTDTMVTDTISVPNVAMLTNGTPVTGRVLISNKKSLILNYRMHESLLGSSGMVLYNR